MSNQRLHGVIVPCITPLDERENVDEAGLRRVIRWLIDAGVHGIFVGGSAGEGPLLADDQWRRMAEIAADAAGDELPLLCGVMDTSSRRVRAKIAILKEIGYRYFVLTPTFYLTIRTAAEHLRLFDEAKQAAGDMEMIAYNIPQCTGATLAVETVCEMAHRGWVRYCKESSGDLAYFQELARRGKDVGLSVLEGDELTMVGGLTAGACGIVPVCANIFPQPCIEAYEAARRGDAAALARAHERIVQVRDVLVVGGACWLAGIKYAAAVLGLASARILSPLEPPSADQRQRIEECLSPCAGLTEPQPKSRLPAQ